MKQLIHKITLFNILTCFILLLFKTPIKANTIEDTIYNTKDIVLSTIENETYKAINADNNIESAGNILDIENPKQVIEYESSDDEFITIRSRNEDWIVSLREAVNNNGGNYPIRNSAVEPKSLSTLYNDCSRFVCAMYDVADKSLVNGYKNTEALRAYLLNDENWSCEYYKANGKIYNNIDNEVNNLELQEGDIIIYAENNGKTGRTHHVNFVGYNNNIYGIINDGGNKGHRFIMTANYFPQYINKRNNSGNFIIFRHIN